MIWKKLVPLFVGIFVVGFSAMARSDAEGTGESPSKSENNSRPDPEERKSPDLLPEEKRNVPDQERRGGGIRIGIPFRPRFP